jgi:glucokinase
VILAADIGGTNARVALFDAAALERPVVEETYPSRADASLGAILRRFRARHAAPVEFACAGVAGPVRNERVEATNLPWVVDAADIAHCVGASRAWLINDLEANAYGLASLAPSDFVTLQEGAPDARGNACVVSAGTGLGEAGLYWDGSAHRPFSSEGGHANFGPRNDLEIELLRWLAARFGHVSWERVLSGPGLVNIYHFLRDSGRGEEPAWLAGEMRAGDAAAVISRHALARTSELCVEALDLFVTLYGVEAGNTALEFLALGGVFLGGGVAPRNLEKLRDGSFLRGFLDKGRMRDVVELMPVRVILNQMTALLGAARCAAMRGGALR